MVMPLEFVIDQPSATTDYRFVPVPTRWGLLGLVCRETIVCRLMFGFYHSRIKTLLVRQYPGLREGATLLPELVGALHDYFEGEPVSFEGRIDLSWASSFQRSVLTACSRIKPGQTRTYGELAHIIGRPRAARAVGLALAANRVPLIIPCHRVIAAGGGLGGFSAEGGLLLKQRLLTLERPVNKTSECI